MQEQIETSINKSEVGNEIDLLQIFRNIWIGRKIIYKTVVIFFVLGIIIVIGTPKEYKSEVTLLVEMESKSGGMSGLLKQFGVSKMNLGSTGDANALSPQVYPDVIKSTPFLLQIMNQKVTESKYDSTLTVTQYFERHTKSSLLNFVMNYTIGLPGKILGLFRSKGNAQLSSMNSKPIIVNDENSGFLKLTPQQASITSTLSGVIKGSEVESNNTFIITVEVQDPLVAAQIADSVAKNLTRYVTDYRTQKAKTDLKFVTARYAEVEVRYNQAQQALAAYTDRNKYLVLATARAEEQRLQNEYTLAFNLYSTLSQQLEQDKLKVQENTPVFKVIEPAKVAYGNSKPNSKLILLGMVFFGVLIGIGIIFLKNIKFN